jgi:two-component sensor histidine kinase
MPISSRFVVRTTFILLGIGLLTLLAIVGLTSWLGQQAPVYVRDAAEAREMRTVAVELRNALQTAESSQRGFILTGNEIYLAPYDLAKQAVARNMAVLTSRLARRQDMLKELAAAVAEKLKELDETIALKRERRDDELMAVVNTNRGKTLMDTVNLFVSSIERVAERRLSEIAEEQRGNADLLFWASIVGGIVIVLVVGGMTFTVMRYASEATQARDEVRTLASGLEERVSRRTADLAQARDRAEVLLAEVNHRVANSLSLVASLVTLQANALKDPAARQALDETQARILAISLVHKRLYTSGDVRFVQLDEYLTSLLEHLETSMRAEGHGGASLHHALEPLRMRTDASVNLGVVVAEWVTNAFKYAYPGERRGDVWVRLKRLADGRAELVVEDDGVGRSEGEIKGTGLGTRIVRGIASAMRADVEYLTRDPGMAARLVFPLPAG